MTKTNIGAAVFYNQKLLEHDPLTEQPEGGRLALIIEHFKQNQIWDGFNIESSIAPMKRLKDIHDREYLNDLHRRSYGGSEQLDENTPLIKESFEIARFGAGGVLDSIDKVMSGEIDTALCLTSMPGHHAGISKFGFGSLVNPVAAGAQYLTKKYSLKKVAIIDLDAEHGRGTQEIFYHRRDVLTISIHEYPGITGTGHYEETGSRGSYGFNINIPIVSGYGDREYRVCLKEIIEKIIFQYSPEFIILGLGTNVLAQDSTSHLVLSEPGLLSNLELVRKMAKQVCNGKIISVLEGGLAGNLMASTLSKYFKQLLNKSLSNADTVKKVDLVSYTDWYRYSKLLKAQFKRYWKI